MMDETRFRAFYNEMYPRLWSYIRRMVAETHECDDIAQESFLRFLRAAPDSLGDSDRRSYLYRIATNLTRDLWRSKQAHSKWLDEQSDDEPAHDNELAITAGVDIGRALEMLSPGQRSLVWLAYVEGHSHQEIAEIVGVKPTSVRVLLMRARQRLAAYFDEGKRG